MNVSFRMDDCGIFISFSEEYLFGYVKTSCRESKYSDYCQRMEEHAASATDEIIGAEVMRLLFQTIDQLPPRCREIFLLYMDGMKNEK